MRRPTSPSTPWYACGATAASRSTTSRTSPTSTTRSWNGPLVTVRTGRPSPSGRPSSSARTWQPCGCSPRPPWWGRSRRCRRSRNSPRGSCRPERPIGCRSRTAPVRTSTCRSRRPRTSGRCPGSIRTRCWLCQPSAGVTPTAPARSTRSMRFCGWPPVRGSPRGRRRSAPAVRGGTSSAQRSPSVCWARPSTSRVAGPTCSSRTTRCLPRTPRSPPGTGPSPWPMCTPAWSGSTARR